MNDYILDELDESGDRTNRHMDVDSVPHIMGIRPHPNRVKTNLREIAEMDKRKDFPKYSVSNFIWSIFIGSWISILFFLSGFVFLLTGVYRKLGFFYFRLGVFILFPFKKCAYIEDSTQDPVSGEKILNIALSPIRGFGIIFGIIISWSSVFYIPMTKTLWHTMLLTFRNDISHIKFKEISENEENECILKCSSSGSWSYFRFTVMSMEVVYLNFTPFIILSLIVGFIDCKGSSLGDPIVGSAFALLGAIPCAYLIGVCVDEISKKMGIIAGSILNSLFLAIVELILYYFSLKAGLVNVARAAITGAFLMNLLIIPGFAMLFAGFKWKEVILNKKAQSIGGTFLLLAIISVLFPSIFYHIHSTSMMKCSECKIINNTTGNISYICGKCQHKDLTNLMDDPIYQKYAGPLMYVMSALMPIIFCTSVVFSVKTHSHIYMIDITHEEGGMNKILAIVLLAISTVMFSIMAHVMTEKIPEAINKLQLSERFVGLIFYTLIPNAAEYMNAIRFALNGNIGLSMEIGNQGAILTSLVEMPALVLISLILYKMKITKDMFTLVFPLIDIFCVIIAVFLRNSILSEKAVNYFTGLSFLIIFTLISVVYYFDTF